MRWELISYHSPCFNKVFQHLSQFSLTDNEGNINKIMAAERWPAGKKFL
jgi:hypothetical protein